MASAHRHGHACGHGGLASTTTSAFAPRKETPAAQQGQHHARSSFIQVPCTPASTYSQWSVISMQQAPRVNWKTCWACIRHHCPAQPLWQRGKGEGDHIQVPFGGGGTVPLEDEHEVQQGTVQKWHIHIATQAGRVPRACEWFHAVAANCFRHRHVLLFPFQGVFSWVNLGIWATVVLSFLFGN